MHLHGFALLLLDSLSLFLALFLSPDHVQEEVVILGSLVLDSNLLLLELSLPDDLFLGQTLESLVLLNLETHVGLHLGLLNLPLEPSLLMLRLVKLIGEEEGIGILNFLESSLSNQGLLSDVVLLFDVLLLVVGYQLLIKLFVLELLGLSSSISHVSLYLVVSEANPVRLVLLL